MQNYDNYVSFISDFKLMFGNIVTYSKNFFRQVNDVMNAVARDYTRPKWVLPAGSEALSQHIYETKNNEYEVMIFRRRLSLIDTIVKCTA